MSLDGIKARNAREVRECILNRDRVELAIIDIRTEQIFAKAHMLWANSVPLSCIELDILDRVPRLNTPIILCSADSSDDPYISRAVTKLEAMGYSDISYLFDGLRGWAEAGFEIFSGVNVPSKAFGEFVEHTYDTPRLPAPELKRMLDEGDNVVVLDSRPMPEYNVMNIPTGIDVPGAELALRVHDLAPDPETTVVVNCAGRTRSIIGCQSLKNAGIPNKVVALENGTMGWHLAGFELGQGNTDTYEQLTEEGLVKALQCANSVKERFGVQMINADTLANWRAEENRTTYLLDVRDPAEFAEGHIPGSRSAPGGQLVQATDRFVGTLGARIVCVDDNSVRAIMTASWLVQIGWDASVLEPGSIEMSETGEHLPTISSVPEVRTLSATELAARMIQVHLVDLNDSVSHRRSHIPGGRFAIRTSMPGNLDQLSKDRPIVLTSRDGTMAKFAAADLIDAGYDREVLVLEGGNAAWKQAKLPMKSGFADNLDPPVDVWFKPYDNDDARKDAMEEYLSWEINLVSQIERDGTTNFKAFD